MSYYFWMITWMKKATNFQIEKIQPQGVVSFCLIFRQFRPGFVYKSVAYKIKHVYVFLTGFILCLKNFLAAPHCFIKMFYSQQS